jgi:anti-sigma factor RsiW
MRRLLMRVMPPDPEHCARIRERFSAYLDGELPTRERRAVTRHVFVCWRCRRVLDNLRRTITELGQLGSGAPLADTEAVERLARGLGDAS